MKEDEIDVLVKYRLDQARESLSDAKFIFNGNRSPLGVINRSYYAVFYASLALLQKTGKVPRKHSGVISLFDHEFVKQGIFPKQFSKILHPLFTARQVSDYHAMEPLGME
ncbi:MAG: HEPN domain-containing protein [Deltaproteobacteria bacterium]|nr:HEPN domain-containing protein [Deltaproteobacteria bacterium]